MWVKKTETQTESKLGNPYSTNKDIDFIQHPNQMDSSTTEHHHLKSKNEPYLQWVITFGVPNELQREEKLLKDLLSSRMPWLLHDQSLFATKEASPDRYHFDESDLELSYLNDLYNDIYEVHPHARYKEE